MILCDCGKQAEQGSQSCRTCREDGQRRAWRAEISFEQTPTIRAVQPKGWLKPSQLREAK